MLIDLHSHILPNVDDGARNMQESIAMISLAVADQTSLMVATPHYIAGVNRYREGDCEQLVRNMQELIWNMNPNIDLLLGHEVMLDDLSVQHIRQGMCHPLGDSNTYLVELPVLSNLPATYSLLARILDMGYGVLLAHPERYPGFSIADFRELKDMGLLFQLNAGSLSPKAGELHKKAWTLLHEELIDVIASDAHSAKNRNPKMQKAYSNIHENCGVESADILFSENPRRILDGKPLMPPATRKRHKRFFMWNPFQPSKPLS